MREASAFLDEVGLHRARLLLVSSWSPLLTSAKALTSRKIARGKKRWEKRFCERRRLRDLCGSCFGRGRAIEG